MQLSEKRGALASPSSDDTAVVAPASLPEYQGAVLLKSHLLTRSILKGSCARPCFMFVAQTTLLEYRSIALQASSLMKLGREG